jgi:hypothetical protein
MDDVIGDTAPVLAVEPVPLVSCIEPIHSKLRLDHIGVLTAVFEREAHLRFRRKLRTLIPIPHRLRDIGIFRFPPRFGLTDQ